MNIAIHAKGVSKAYGNFFALDTINLMVPAKSIFGIIGTSGAGKTTLLKILSTLEKPTHGELDMFGQAVPYHDSEALRTFRQKIGVIFQNYQLLNSLSVFDNIALPLRIAKYNEDTIQKEVARILKLVGLDQKSHLHPALLSGGQKQRVAIARALIVQPKILLCDEPTAALDPENTHGVLSLLQEIRDQLDTTIVIVTHEVGLIGGICDLIAIVHNGQVAETGPVHEIFFNPKAPCTEKLLNPKPAKIKDFFDDRQAASYRLFQLKFMGESAKTPLISRLVSSYKIHPNILAGNIDKVGSSSLGQLIVSFDRNEPLLEDALQFLKNHQVLVQELA